MTLNWGLFLDPGTYDTGWTILDCDTYEIIRSDKSPNAFVLKMLSEDLRWNKIICEDMTNFGKNGQTIIDTVKWMGRFQQVAFQRELPHYYITRATVKKHMTGHVVGSNDSKVRQAVIDRLEPTYTRKNPGKLKGVSKDMWSAVAIAITWNDIQKGVPGKVLTLEERKALAEKRKKRGKKK